MFERLDSEAHPVKGLPTEVFHRPGAARDVPLSAPTGAPSPGARWGAFSILRLLGRGGMGAVYLARDERLQRDVALKVLLHGALAGQEELARFRVEATATAGLSHPGIVQLYEAGEHDGLRYLVMEYVEGEPLDQWMARDRIPRQRVIELVAGMADALDAAHQQGVIHRDVKPSNVVVDPVGHPRSRRAVVLVLVARGSA